MPSIGDLVTNLILNATQYQKGANDAIGSNRALSGSIDSIVGQLQRQKKEMQGAGRTTTENILGAATKGATEGEINAALALQEEVEALRREKKAQDEATAAKMRADEAGENLIQTLTRQKEAVEMTAEELVLYRAKQAGASTADLDRARTLQSEIRAAREAKEAQESLTKEISRGSIVNGGLSRSSMILTEATRGLEDAVAGFTNNGLKGMLMATTNNIGQIGALAGGAAGLAISIGSVAALIGVSLIPKLIEWATNTEALAKEQERLRAESKKTFDQELDQMQRLNKARLDTEKTRGDFSDRLNNLTKADDIRAELERVTASREGTFGDRDTLQKTIDRMQRRNPEITNPIQDFVNRPDRTWAGFLDETLVGGDASGRNNEESAKQREARLKEHEALNEKKKEFQKHLHDLQELQRQDDLRAEQQRELRKRLETATAKEAAEARAKAVNDGNVKEAQAWQKRLEEDFKREEAQRALGVFKDQMMMPQKNLSAASQVGTTAAYSSIVQAMTGRENDRLIRSAKENAEMLAEHLARIEGKEQIKVTTLSV